MISLRSIRDLLTEAVCEALALADFLIRRADDRWMLPAHEHQWIDHSTLADADVHEMCVGCGQERTMAR